MRLCGAIDGELEIMFSLPHRRIRAGLRCPALSSPYFDVINDAETARDVLMGFFYERTSID